MILTTMLFALIGACTSAPKAESARNVASSEHTIWSLQEMAQKGEFDELNDLFNNQGINLSELPVGYAAGAGARVLHTHSKPVMTVIDNFTGKTWRGKVFFRSQDGKMSKGLNRIKKNPVKNDSPITPMASFQVELVDHDSLVPEAHSNVIILNYSKPLTKPYLVERLLTQVEVYDVVVAVPGKFGPVMVGKTFLGHYGKDRHFHALSKDKLIAWFFLDFSEAALKAQKEEHWEGGTETLLDPIPTVTETLSTLAQ